MPCLHALTSHSDKPPWHNEKAEQVGNRRKRKVGSMDLPHWQTADYHYIASRATLIAFDLDGTMARSKMPMKREDAELLSKLTYSFPVAIISGGRWDLIDSQILSMISSSADLSRLHLMPTTGTRYYSWNGAGWVCQYEINIDPQDREHALASVRRRAQELGFWYPQDRVWGERIDDRGSQITFSALGQQAPVDAKEAWDPDGSRRQALAQVIQADLPELTVRAGGATSVDISVKGVDKSYAVRELAQTFSCPLKQIVFLGDRMTPEGNDYPAAKAGTYAIEVAGPQDTARFISRLLRELGR